MQFEPENSKHCKKLLTHIFENFFPPLQIIHFLILRQKYIKTRYEIKMKSSYSKSNSTTFFQAEKITFFDLTDVRTQFGRMKTSKATYNFAHAKYTPSGAKEKKSELVIRAHALIKMLNKPTYKLTRDVSIRATRRSLPVGRVFWSRTGNLGAVLLERYILTNENWREDRVYEHTKCLLFLGAANILWVYYALRRKIFPGFFISKKSPFFRGKKKPFRAAFFNIAWSLWKAR